MLTKLNRRDFLRSAMAAVTTSNLVDFEKFYNTEIISVQGATEPNRLGITLPHEHLMVDFVGADKVSKNRYNPSEVVEKALPYLLDLKKAGCQSLAECTPAYLGRDPQILKTLAEKSGIRILTNTGYYGARDDQHLPPHAFTESADQLAARWIEEFENGIDGTGIKPGFIKIGMDRGNLSAIDRKLIQAASKTHLKTGLTIAAHTGTAPGAFDQLDVLEEEGVSANAWIWVHAQAEKDKTLHVMAAKRGAWVEFDGYGEGKEAEYLQMLQNMKNNRLLGQVLISQDAGWYHVGEPDGGNFKPFDPLFNNLLPHLKENDFTDEEIEQLVVVNPMKAFTIKIRKA